MKSGMEIAPALARAVEAEGGRAYFVGGCVRDRMLGRENKDVDIEVHGLAPEQLEQILKALGQPMEMGMSFGVYGLRGYDIDIAMPRQETATGRGHRDFKVAVDPFLGTEKAAMRRDFTINAMMEDVLTGQVLDHFGGREDLARGIIRHVNEQSFREDALRVLRCAQFAARFEFQVAPETAALCKTMDLSALPRERVMEELKKALLKGEKPSIFFRVLSQMDQLEVWFPEVAALRGVEQNPRFHAEGDVWEHTLGVLDEAAGLRQQAKDPLGLMLSALCHDLGKAVSSQVVNGAIHAYDHEQAGLPLARALVGRLTGQKQLRRYVENMVQLHMRPNIQAAVQSAIKATNAMFDRSVCPEDLILLARADRLGSVAEEPQPDATPFLEERLGIYRAYMARPQVTGADLMAAGLEPGPEFREVLTHAHKLALAGVEKESALRQSLGYARKLEKKK